MKTIYKPKYHVIKLGQRLNLAKSPMETFAQPPTLPNVIRIVLDNLIHGYLSVTFI